MTIRLTIAGSHLDGTLDDTEVAREFAAMLPLTLTLTDFAGSEKIADLPSRLDTSTAPDGAAGQPGDLAYYAPWGNLAIFYRASQYATGLVHLGALDPGATQTLAEHQADLTITIEATQ